MPIKTYLARSQWSGAALCVGEPDLIMWTDDVTNLPCAIVRSDLGHLCGYVGVPYGYTIDTDKLQVHGGITYNDQIHPLLPWANHDVIGFDCVHSGDASLLRPQLPHEQYRNVGYVLTEVNNLVQQVYNNMQPGTY